MASSFVLGDGRFRCRELPFEIEFPAGATIERGDDALATLFFAKVLGGLGVIVMPRMKLARWPLDQIVERLVKENVPDTPLTRRDATPVPGASEAVGFALALPGGGVGEVRGYLVDHWVVAVMAGGSAEMETRPDGPVGAKFLSSFRTRPVMDGPVRFDLPDGARIEIPGSAWPMARMSQDKGPRTAWAFHLPDRDSFLGLLVLDPAVCSRLAAARDDKLEAELRPLFSDQPIQIRRVERARLGDTSAFIEFVRGKFSEASYVICHGKSLLQVSVFAHGQRDYSKLRAMLDPFARTFVGAR